MDDRQKTLAAVTIIVGFFVVIIVVVGILLSGKKVISPIPEDSAIKIIFVTQTPTASQVGPTITPTLTLTPSPTPKAK